MMQLSLPLPGTVLRHAGSGERVVVAEDQTPIRGMEWIYDRGLIVNVITTQGQRIPMYGMTLVPEMGGRR